MSDTIDRTDCLAFERLAIAYHDAGHAVGAVVVSPQLPLKSVTIAPHGDFLGLTSYEDWDELVVPDPYEEDSHDDLSEDGRNYERAWVTHWAG